jgi:hypothetical protein
MDSTRFDALTRSLATATNRRALIRSALAAVAAGVGGAMGRGSVLADGCKEDGKLCKKHEQCCSGLCKPSPGASSTAASDSVCCTPDSNESTCSGLCGLQTNNCGQSVDCGECCIPDPREVTCAGVYGPQENNCKQIIDCDLGTGEPCAGDEQCASDHCCETCVDCSTVSETATSCGICGNCCECFLDNKPGGSGGPFCCDPDKICGTYPHDSCREANETCVDGVRVKTVYVCPHEPGGELVDCRGITGAGCCNGVCCPTDKPVCAGVVNGVGGVCVAEESCSYQDGVTTICLYGACTANKWFTDGVCCAGGKMGSWSPGVDGNGEAVIRNECCGLNQQWPNRTECPTCQPLDYCGCNECTSRGSTPRIS